MQITSLVFHPPDMSVLRLVHNEKHPKQAQTSFFRSQLALFQSRKKWGAMYSLATLAGIFCVPGIIDTLAAESELSMLVSKVAVLPVITLLIATGMYILNDLVDVDLDKSNGKKRPIPSGLVSKRQAWSFIAWTNGAAVLLSLVTFNIASMILVAPMLAIGIMYSAPMVSLANRFVIKTLSIALFYVLCAILGATSAYGFDLTVSSPATPLYAAIMLGAFIFVSSVFNDLGDVDGDRAAGRRTIPIVIGKVKAVKMGVIIAVGMAGASWILYASDGIGLASAIITSSFSTFIITRMAKTLTGLDDMEFMRKQHKKLFPLHMVLQLALASGILLA